ncbi:MAG: hypothetical protein LC662_02785 [Rhodothermaceae bacterium]|nr:hypothetical protein [Rhodothermaceae bacterium]
MAPTSYFPNVNKIEYEGPGSDNPLAYTYYDENKTVAGKTMKEHFRFAVAYWHSFCGGSSDPFGAATRVFTWDKTSDPVENAKFRLWPGRLHAPVQHQDEA